MENIEKCLNKIRENQPELKVAEKGIKGEEDFFYACGLCEGYNSSCPEYKNGHKRVRYSDLRI